jgi:Ca-activated chloride channel homolog
MNRGVVPSFKRLVPPSPATMSVTWFCVRRCSPRATLGFLIVALLFTSGAFSQSEDPVHIVPREKPGTPVETDVQRVEGEPTVDAHIRPLRVDVELVLVPVTVTDTLNHPVTGLQRQDFTIYEHDQPQEIRYFSAEDGPISVGLILDLSKSMSDKIQTERAAVTAFFQSANPDDDYFAIGVSDRPTLLADSTQSLGTLEAKVASPDGNTALLDAVYMGVTHMRSARYQRRALLIISDGGDNHSRYRLREIKDIIREADIQIYAIGIFDTALFKTFEEYMGKKWLGEITDTTGGRTLTVDKLDKLPEAAAAVSWELRSQYVLGYRPPSTQREGGWRKIKVRVKPGANSQSLQAYYKRGYSATEK